MGEGNIVYSIVVLSGVYDNYMGVDPAGEDCLALTIVPFAVARCAESSLAAIPLFEPPTPCRNPFLNISNETRLSIFDYEKLWKAGLIRVLRVIATIEDG